MTSTKNVLYCINDLLGKPKCGGSHQKRVGHSCVSKLLLVRDPTLLRRHFVITINIIYNTEDSIDYNNISSVYKYERSFVIIDQNYDLVNAISSIAYCNKISESSSPSRHLAGHEQDTVPWSCQRTR